MPGSAFCPGHATAPAGRRGGWLSAHRRAVAANGAELDASLVDQRLRLWVGAAPPLEQPLPRYGMLVLCAREIQPPAVGFAGRLLRAPLPDAPLDRLELGRALAASRRVADASRAGQAVLVTCAMGRNRSALVAALAMLRLTRMSASDVVEQIRRNRAPECLTNPAFVKIVHWFAALPARR